MTVDELNNTRKGREMFYELLELHDQMNEVLLAVRRATNPAGDGAYVEWDDSGFVEVTD